MPLPGKAKWDPKERNGSPSTPDVIAETKQKAILVVPIAFTTDHIETLDEIDIEFRGYADEVVDHFARVDCFNMEEKFIDLCAKLVIEHIENDFKSSIRPCCVNCEGRTVHPCVSTLAHPRYITPLSSLYISFLPSKKFVETSRV